MNWIEWRVEQPTPSLSTLEFFLRQLFIMMRRVRKYEDLVHNQIARKPPLHWSQGGAASEADKVLAAMNSDHQQVAELLRRNKARIKETVELITAMMTVAEGKRSNTLNQALFFLTIIATIALPFQICAAIYGLEGDYGPGKKEWPQVRKLAGSIAASLIACFGAMVFGFWGRSRVISRMVE